MSNPAQACVVGACVALGLARAYAFRWSCDDAFIGFRYAENLARGDGLVFNVGERVEGYTNLLWTIGIAPAFLLGISPEAWTQAWGAAFYAVTVLILGALHAVFATTSLRGRRAVVPFAALAAASHREWAIFAVSGLETAAFVCAALAGFAVLAWPSDRRRALRGALAGGLFGLATLYRPDGIAFGAAAGLWTVGRAAAAWFEGRRAPAAAASRRSEVTSAALYALVFVAFVAGQTLFRASYYGELLPNTYYAKSGGVAWYAQGLLYLWGYILRYPPLVLAPMAMAWIVARPRSSALRRKVLGPASLAMLLGAVHAFWCVRVGGDFMFARFLIPSTAFFLVVLELGLITASETRPRAATAGAVAAVAAIAFLPSPLLPNVLEGGIMDEYAYYSRDRVDFIEAQARAIRPVLEGLDARVAFYSSQARLVYRARLPLAVESETGLTDAFVARQAVSGRRRVGHEKRAPASYLVDVRRVHLATSARRRPEIDGHVPYVPIVVGGVNMRLLHWDPDFVRRLRARGVEVPDYPAMLEAAGPILEGMTLDEARREHARARHFYFAFVDDPRRERPFLERLAREQ
ncbi:MAG: hypothetical protein KF764_18455 [Labilithrix sp.]|nr:hypothetical protein [Labilithrix sp.]